MLKYTVKMGVRLSCQLKFVSTSFYESFHFKFLPHVEGYYNFSEKDYVFILLMFYLFNLESDNSNHLTSV